MNKLKWIKVLSASVILSLTACSEEPEWMSIYNDCQDKMNESIAQIKQSPDAPEGMEDMMQSMGLAACEMIKNTCENAPEGAMCQAIIKSNNEE